MDELARLRAKGIKPELEWDALDQPTGDYAKKLQSYIGVLTRQHVKVSIDRWEDVPHEAIFVMREEWKKDCLSSASNKFQTWKSNLYKKHILKHIDSPHLLKIAPRDTNIDDDYWHSFALSRLTASTKKKSAEFAQQRDQNLYPHHMSCKGYARLHKNWRIN